MPIIRIQALRNDHIDVKTLLEETSQALADAFRIESTQCWSCFSEIRPGEYFEGGRHRGVSDTSHTPLVTVSAYEGRSEKDISKALDAVATKIKSSFGKDAEDVFIEYHELRSGQVYTGGGVI